MTDLRSTVAGDAPARPVPRVRARPSDGPSRGTGGDGSTPPDHAAGIVPGGTPSGRVIHIPDVPVRKVTALALLGVGALLVAFVGYLLAFTPLTAARNQQRLAQSVSGQPKFRFGLATGTVPPEGTAVAILTIGTLRLHQVVVEGTSAADLMNGPGLMPGSALPGSPGNSVVAGRRVTFGAPFGSLGALHRGDAIRVVDGAGTFTYRVTGARVVTPGQFDVVTPTTDNRMTLITSDSSISTSGRLVVVARLVGRPVVVPGGPLAIPTYELGLSGDPVAGGLAMFWSLLSILVLVLAGLVAWQWRHPWLVYLFAAPVVAACGLFACESVARVLPATY